MCFLDPTPAYQISHFAKTFSPFHSRPIIRSKKTKYILKGQVQILNKTLVFFLFYKRTFYSTITVLVKGSYDTINHSDKGILFVAFQEHVCIHFYRVTIACEGDHNLGCPRGTRTKTVLNWGILKKNHSNRKSIKCRISGLSASRLIHKVVQTRKSRNKVSLWVFRVSYHRK